MLPAQRYALAVTDPAFSGLSGAGPTGGAVVPRPAAMAPEPVVRCNGPARERTGEARGSCTPGRAAPSDEGR